jgi:FkbM family methyltransferase
MPNFKKYKKFKIGYGRSVPLKLLEYTRDQLRSKKFNNSTGKKIKLIDFINHVNGISEVEVTPSDYKFQKQVGGKIVSFMLRKNSSDPYVYNQIIEEEEYRFVVDFLEDKSKEYVFMDFGANVGLTTLYLSAHFPFAKIISFEPEPSSYSTLKRHIELNGLNQVKIYNKGLYTKDTILYANRTFRDKELWSFRLDEEDAGGAEKLEVLSLTSILAADPFPIVDFMKIDIEGGELALLKDPVFLKIIQSTVKMIMMEIHPEVIGYDEAKEILRNAGFLVFNVAGSSVGLNKSLGFK